MENLKALEKQWLRHNKIEKVKVVVDKLTVTEDTKSLLKTGPTKIYDIEGKRVYFNRDRLGVYSSDRALL